MKVIVCLDNRNGMLFNGRRQSRDRVVTADIAAQLDGTLRLAPFSEKLFAGVPAIVSETFLDEAAPGDWCFVEREALLPYADKIERLVVYRWNRDYPGDVFLDLPLAQWQMTQRSELKGFSHEILTKEVYAL